MATNRLPNDIRMFIVKHLAAGEGRNAIVELVQKEFKRKIHPMTVYNISKRQANDVAIVKNQIVKDTATSAVALKNKANNLIARKLDLVEADMDKVQKAREDYQRGFITKHEFDTLMSTYEKATLYELASISKEASAQAKAEDPNEPTAQDAAALAMMLEAIRSGNPVNIIHAVNSPTPSSQSLEA